MSKKYLSGRVERTSQSDLTTDRYEYLGLEQTEPNLGDPLVGPLQMEFICSILENNIAA